MINSQKLIFLTGYGALGYKNAVQAFYEKKLAEARTEAQDIQYPLQGDVSTVMVYLGIFVGIFQGCNMR